MDDFDRAMEFVLAWEGGSTITRDPDDPGGTTKYGISQRAHPDVNVAKLTEDQAKAIYRKQYWDAAGCDELPWPLCLAVMDYAVNSGVKRVKDALDDLPNRDDPRGEAYELNAIRMAFLLDLAQRRRSSRKYVRGWMNRVSALFDTIRTSA